MSPFAQPRTVTAGVGPASTLYKKSFQEYIESIWEDALAVSRTHIDNALARLFGPYYKSTLRETLPGAAT